jgi:hypothetical protein
MASVDRLTITVDRDWLALAAFRVTLERIVTHEEEMPWASSEAADLAREVLSRFPP